MVPKFNTKIFGKSASGAHEYHGNVFAKLKKLAADLKSELKIDQEDFPKTSSGDGGLDLVSWFSFKDFCENTITIAGQCKCSRKWPDVKSSGVKLKSYIKLSHDPINMMFIPFDFRRVNRGWYNTFEVEDTVLVDRLRLCKLLGKRDIKQFGESDIPKIINEVLDSKEGVYQ